jgi:heme/copper-type cytochrome/quinol oxidase subunit 3
MRLWLYLPAAVVAFVAATTGSDLIARTSIAGQTLRQAFVEHVHWVVVQIVGTFLLLAPFVALGFLCAALEKDIRTRSVMAIFAAGALGLIFLYFDGYQAAEQFARQRMWTAATLSIGFLPFKSVVVLLLCIGASALATKFDPRWRSSGH